MKLLYCLLFASLNTATLPNDCYESTKKNTKTKFNKFKPTSPTLSFSSTPTSTTTTTTTTSSIPSSPTSTTISIPTSTTTSSTTTTSSSPTTTTTSSIPSSTTTTSSSPSTTSTFATYYFRMGSDVPMCVPVQNFNTGNIYGSCGQPYGAQSKYWVAIANGGNYCGRQILATYNGNSITLTVMDTCPACQSDNHLDMGLEALIELTGSATAACAINQPLPQISWRFM